MWFKVDDQLTFHPKVLAAGNAAMGLWVRAGSWCAAHSTQGQLPRHMIGTLGAQSRDARRLVDAGLWEQTDVGYAFRDWHHYQPTKEQVEAKRKADRERQKRHRGKAGNGGSHGVTPDVTPPVTNGVRNGTPTRPDPEPKGSVVSRKRATRLPEDWEPTQSNLDWAREKCPDVDVERSTFRFRNHWLSKGGKDGAKIDWSRAWQNWLVKDQQDAERRRPPSSATRSPDGRLRFGDW